MNLNFKNEPSAAEKRNSVINIGSVESELGKGIGTDLTDLWSSYGEITFGNGVVIYKYEDVKERNEVYEINKYAPDYILVGDDGGGQGLFLKRNDTEYTLYYLDLGAVGSADFHDTGLNFFDWLQQSAALEEPAAIEEEDMVLPVTVLVVKSPPDALKFIMDSKRIFNLPFSISEFKDNLKNIPFVLLSKITLTKYGKQIDELNEKYHCLSVVSSTNPQKILLKP